MIATTVGQAMGLCWAKCCGFAADGASPVNL